MINLICFPHYTCGGILTDIFYNTFSEVGDHGGINSIKHAVGKIGDSNTVFDTYNADELMQNIKSYDDGTNVYVGTHCWPGILDTTKFNCVYNVTTATHTSKLYRWARAYYHYYSKTVEWTSLSGQERIDKERETAKNYLDPFLPVHSENCVNIEFSEFVNQTAGFKHNAPKWDYSLGIKRWQHINSFLYNNDFWSSTPVKRYYEAEFEINLQKYYIYH